MWSVFFLSLFTINHYTSRTWKRVSNARASDTKRWKTRTTSSMASMSTTWNKWVLLPSNMLCKRVLPSTLSGSQSQRFSLSLSLSLSLSPSLSLSLSFIGPRLLAEQVRLEEARSCHQQVAAVHDGSRGHQGEGAVLIAPWTTSLFLISNRYEGVMKKDSMQNVEKRAEHSHRARQSRSMAFRFYLQGGDWGSVIVSNLARMYPEK